MQLFKTIKSLQLKLSINQLIGISSVFILLTYNQSFWSALFSLVNISQPKYLLFISAVFLLLFFILFLLLSLFSSRRTIKYAICLLFIISSITSYYMDYLGTVFDPTMIQNIAETDYKEASELINFTIIIHVLIYGLIPSLVLFRIKLTSKGSFKKELFSRFLMLLIIFSATILNVFISYKDIIFIFRENRPVLFLSNPIFPIRSVFIYNKSILGFDKTRKTFQTVFNDIQRAAQSTSSSKKKLFILIIGETARAQSFSINGYHRETSPRLEKQDIINFTNASSCGTSTAVSLPCMFSYLKRENYEGSVARHSENFLDALNHAGIDVMWLDNNSGCKGICSRIDTKTIIHIDTDNICNTNGCFDEILLHQVKQHIENLKADTFIVLHQNGSHGPAYYKRYPEEFSKFTPECRSATVQDCSTQEVINAYDNTILYTDYFISSTIDFLKSKSDQFDTALLYVSDHGESLGENGIFLHGLPYFMAPDTQTHIPFIAWISSTFAQHQHIDINCLKNNADKPISHDNLLHSMLGIFDVQTHIYEKDYDIFVNCRNSLPSVP